MSWGAWEYGGVRAVWQYGGCGATWGAPVTRRPVRPNKRTKHCASLCAELQWRHWEIDRVLARHAANGRRGSSMSPEVVQANEKRRRRHVFSLGEKHNVKLLITAKTSWHLSSPPVVSPACNFSMQSKNLFCLLGEAGPWKIPQRG